jgi:hypothetical protein
MIVILLKSILIIRYTTKVKNDIDNNQRHSRNVKLTMVSFFFIIILNVSLLIYVVIKQKVTQKASDHAVRKTFFSPD